MTDYSKMSDFEINAAVFEAIHGGAPDYKEGDGSAMVLISYEGDVVGGDAVEVAVERGAYNPCNNPADAWPIIKENEISLCAYRRENPEMNAVSWLGADSFCKNMTRDDNPLRAAMIVFLMMKDVEKC